MIRDKISTIGEKLLTNDFARNKIPSLTVEEIKKRYNPQFIRVTAFCDLVLMYSNV